ncbi:ABC-three component system middle component 5 [Flavobacterium columnare]|uniref:ABC-three component system middle component 5 n=1 Tax=Flavobacterium columnare TaxID=996 RepID=UPI003C2F0D70
MITYNQAFDYYHCIFRIIHLLTHFKRNEYVELDRLRIWDFYLLFPEQVFEIRLKRNESDIKALMKKYIKKKNNPYNEVYNNKKVFEKIRPYQMTAINCLASYGIIDKELLKENRVSIISEELLTKYSNNFIQISDKEKNVIAIMTSHFANISMFGPDGLKNRTKLMESKYDS